MDQLEKGACMRFLNSTVSLVSSVLILGTVGVGCGNSPTQSLAFGADLKAQQSPSTWTGEYIDAHNHLHARLPARLGVVPDYGSAASRALAIMDRLSIKKMIIMPPPFPVGHPARYDIEDLIPVVNRYPDRFVFLGGGGTLNVMIQKAVRDGRIGPKLRKVFKRKALEILSKGALGFGEMTAEHLCLGPRHNHQSAPPDHPLFLLLADIAARYNVPIDIHMEAVPGKMPLPQWFRSPPNPKYLAENIERFERLLAHNRKAKIIWAHVGWDNTGHRTAALIAELLRKHPNLYMSFKISPLDSEAESRPIERGIGLKAEWLQVIRRFPDRFIIGSDEFYVSRMAHRIGPPSARSTNKFFSLLPRDLARKIGYENPIRIFKALQYR
jgi:hypothetical protein